jgi:hypothetical protein
MLGKSKHRDINFGKMEYTLEEIGILYPRDYKPVQSHWDGLERILTKQR